MYLMLCEINFMHEIKIFNRYGNCLSIFHLVNIFNKLRFFVTNNFISLEIEKIRPIINREKKKVNRRFVSFQSLDSFFFTGYNIS